MKGDRATAAGYELHYGFCKVSFVTTDDDDFGAGFSSLNLLRSLPLHSVKIDRSLIEPMPATDASAVVRAICNLADVLKLEVVAEGVEREDQADAARNAGCHALQGFLYSMPLSAPEAARWLREGRQAA